MKSFAAVYAVGTIAALAVLCADSARAEERVGTSMMPEKTEELPRKAEPSNSLFSFFKDRTQFGYGFEERFTDNLLAADNNKEQEFISTLEAEVFFSDPRGTLLYGIDYEINQRYYHNRKVQAADKDFHIFIDMDPGGRYKYGLRYDFTVDNSFTFGTKANFDTVQRFSALHRDISHDLGLSYRYALNDTNWLVPRITYAIDRTVKPKTKTADRNISEAMIDIDHDLSPNWIALVGYGYQDIVIPANKLKNATAHGIRTGLQYELSEIANLETLLSIIRRQYVTGKIVTGPSFDLKWKYQPNPRTLLKLDYTDSHIPSYGSTFLEFRSSHIQAESTYELTPLIKVTTGGSYGRSKSGGNTLLPGAAPPLSTKASNIYNFKTTVEWDVRDKLHVSLYYNYTRAREADHTENSVILQIERGL